MATTGRGVGNYELDVIHSPALECPFAVMSNDIGLPLFFCTESMPLWAENFSCRGRWDRIPSGMSGAAVRSCCKKIAGLKKSELHCRVSLQECNCMSNLDQMWTKMTHLSQGEDHGSRGISKPTQNIAAMNSTLNQSSPDLKAYGSVRV